MNVEVHHVVREANTMANSLVKQGIPKDNLYIGPMLELLVGMVCFFWLFCPFLSGESWY